MISELQGRQLKKKRKRKTIHEPNKQFNKKTETLRNKTETLD